MAKVSSKFQQLCVALDEPDAQGATAVVALCHINALLATADCPMLPVRPLPLLLRVPLPPWLRHCRCLVCSNLAVAKTLPLLAALQDSVRDELVAEIRTDLQIDTYDAFEGSSADSAQTDGVSYTVFECLWKQVLALGDDTAFVCASTAEAGLDCSSCTFLFLLLLCAFLLRCHNSAFACGAAGPPPDPATPRSSTGGSDADTPRSMSGHAGSLEEVVCFHRLSAACISLPFRCVRVSLPFNTCRCGLTPSENTKRGSALCQTSSGPVPR